MLVPNPWLREEENYDEEEEEDDLSNLIHQNMHSVSNEKKFIKTKRSSVIAYYSNLDGNADSINKLLQACYLFIVSWFYI